MNKSQPQVTFPVPDSLGSTILFRSIEYFRGGCLDFVSMKMAGCRSQREWMLTLDSLEPLGWRFNRSTDSAELRRIRFTDGWAAAGKYSGEDEILARAFGSPDGVAWLAAVDARLTRERLESEANRDAQNLARLRARSARKFKADSQRLASKRKGARAAAESSVGAGAA